MILKEKLARITQDLPATCKLIAVSKTHPVEAIVEAFQAGQRIFGENKVQELVPKYEKLPKDIQWHLIGHLQSNKVKYIAPFISMIHSVDSFKLLEEINKQAKKHNRIIHCLLQIHIAAEETKFGLNETELFQLIEQTGKSDFANVKIVGLMGMATLTDEVEKIKQEFAGLKRLFETLKSKALPPQFEMKELSMGMSSDYQIAIQEGSTFVRVGSSIFGQRNYTI
jgi:hypothetical protein